MNYLNQFETHLRSSDRSENTIKSYLKTVRQFDNWLRATYDIDDISIIQFREIKHFREKLLERLAPSSVNQTLSGLKTFFSYLVELKAIQSNPAEKIKLQKIVDHSDHKYLSRSEELMAIKKAQEKSVLWHAILLTFLKSGIRVSELSNLRLNDISLDKEPTLVVKNSKGHKSRYIPLTNDLILVLRLWLDARNNSNKIYHQRSPYLFISQRQEKLTARGIQRILSQIGKSAGIHLHPIRLRSTFAFNLIDSGAPLSVVQQLLGHSSMEMVVRYGKPSFKNKRDYLERLSEI